MLKRILITILISLSGFFLYLPQFDFIENSVYDKFLVNQYGNEGTLDNVIIIDIDEKTIKRSDKSFHAWDRSYYTHLIEKLASKDLAVLGFDILFSHKIEEKSDKQFANSLTKIKTITGYEFTNSDPYNFIYPDTVAPINSIIYERTLNNNSGIVKEIINIGVESFNLSSANSGHFVVDQGNDGVVRTVPLFINYLNRVYPSFSLSIVMQYLGVDFADIELNDGKELIINRGEQTIKIPLDSDNKMNICYSGTWKTFRTISLYDVLNKYIGKKTFKDKIAIVGSSKQGLYDLRTIPGGFRMPGVEIHANIIDTILNQKFIKRNSVLLSIFISSILILFTTICINYIKSLLLSILTIFIVFAIYNLSSYNLFLKNFYYLDQMKPLILLLVTFISGYLMKYYSELKDRKFIERTFGKFIPESVSKHILENRFELKLGGEKRNVSMIFVDLIGFSSISEKMDPEKVVDFLNIFLSRTTMKIKENNGTLDKYLGDGFIALFGAPLDCDHKYLSCKAALEIVKEVEELKSEIKTEEFKSINVSIGINTDFVTVGNIGSEDFFDYTAIGSGMNLASRLEGLNRVYGSSIIVSESTLEKNNDYNTRLLDKVTVKGYITPVKIYELQDKKKVYNDVYEKAVQHYIDGRFEEAEKLLYSIEYQDRASQIMIDRVRKLKSYSEWKGYWEYKQK
ncbi:MAG: adenylate/guanylate cyclase domain-containing protein [Candidatus Delongbacteria bacterium]|nr:adenylate/guanylate cyclase domain-containing protein [Candidatus Delongbacteria bacterium]MBN2834838.1 adenylate/guanylate cyclase domain-containing protein [Candidatus Delongbacteria bacterium]